ncbi:hypothetical protein FACS1894105_09860 [Clostridia bacterium]|nr:hypothetical protein FACS1894105_09860 [Clostridia bacterium]
MIAGIKTECYKLLRNKYVLFSAVVAFFGGAIINLAAGEKEHLFYQVQIFPYLFQILSCLIVGSVWALDYTYGTIKNTVYLFKRSLIFAYKTVTVIGVGTLIFLLYAYGLLLTDYEVFSQNMLGNLCVPYLLFLAQIFTMVLFTVAMKSFSKISIVMLVSIFVYRLFATLPESSAVFPLAKQTYFWIYYAASENYTIEVLYGALLFLAFWLFFGVVGSMLYFQKNDI